jgi:hypothetical protein
MNLKAFTETDLSSTKKNLQALQDFEELEPVQEEEIPVDDSVIARAVRSVGKGGEAEIMAAIKDYDPEKDGNPPVWAANTDIWQQACRAIDPDKYDDPWAVIAHVYDRLGGGIKEDNEEVE